MNPLLDSRQLLAFQALARSGSFTQAARDIFLTQSAVSHTIKALERELGVRLFDRVGKRAQLTASGELLLSHTDKILREMRDARTAISDLQSWGHSRLRVGASTTACQHVLPTVLREFKQSFPHCVIKIEPGDHAHQLELLRSGEIDLALTLGPSGQSDVKFLPLFQDDLRFVVSPLHPWARQGGAIRDQIGNELLVLYNAGSYTFRLVADYFRKEDIILGNFIELGSMEAIKELVKVGVGAGIIAPWVARAELADGSLVSLPLGRTKLRRQWGICHLNGKRLSLAEETFTGLCQAVTVGLSEPARKEGAA